MVLFSSSVAGCRHMPEMQLFFASAPTALGSGCLVPSLCDVKMRFITFGLTGMGRYAPLAHLSWVKAQGTPAAQIMLVE